MVPRLVLSLCLMAGISRAQVAPVPYHESFDSLAPPLLPAGWSTSSARSAAGDFITAASSAASAPNAVLSTNAAVEQWLATPAFDFSGVVPESLAFAERRSSSHNAGFVVEAAVDTGQSPIATLSETLANPGTTAYVRRSISLAGLRDFPSPVRLFFHLLGDGTGTTGTFRLDDIVVTVRDPVDGAVSAIALAPSIPAEAEPFTATITVVNRGFSPLERFRMTTRIDTLSPGGQWLFDVREETRDLPLPAGDSSRVTIAQPVAPSVPFVFTASISVAGDRQTSNDTLRDTVRPALRPGSVVINEILYDPPPGCPEYVELFNVTPHRINLGGWIIADHRDTSLHPRTSLPEGIASVPPGGFAVVTSDSALLRYFSPIVHEKGVLIVHPSWSSLNNTGDHIVMIDHAGRAIDSILYSPSWHNPAVDITTGKSLERISPALPGNDARNWSTSADRSGGTPGRTNSLYAPTRIASSRMAVAPNPFSPDGDGLDDHALIAYTLPFSDGVIRMSIYDARGRMVRILADAEPAGPEGTIVWDGLGNGGRKLPIGVYIVLMEAVEPSTGRTDAARAVVVLAAKL